MKTNQILKVLIITLVSAALPLTQSYAVVPNTASILSDVAYIESRGNFGGQFNNEFFHVSTQDLLAVISSATATDDVDIVIDDSAVEQTEDISEEELIGTILDGESKPKFWTGRKIIIGGTILLAVTGTVLLIALLLGSGGGSGSASGAGAAGGGSNLSSTPTGDGTTTPPGDGLNNGDVPPGDPNDPADLTDPNDTNLTDPPGGDGNPFVPGGGCVGALCDTGTGNPPFTNPDGSGIPHNPEPSTLLLMGLGLLVPFFRKRNS